MRHSSLLLPTIVFVTVVVAGSLYLFGGPSVNDPATMRSAGGVRYAVLAQGTDAVGIDRRVNYRIRTQEEFVALWDLMYGGSGPTIPIVDFPREEVYAVFNGTHSSTGYRVRVSDIRDGNGVRTLTLVREEPGAGCTPAIQITSPFVLIRATASPLPIERVEQTAAVPCAP